MIRVYIIAANTPERLRFAREQQPGGSTRAVPALQEVVEIKDLADPVRMRALAVDFHSHFSEKKHG